MNKRLPDGQLDFTPLLVDQTHRAVMDNAMIMGRWDLSQYALYILRVMISKVKKGDTKFECYYVTTSKLAKALNIKKSQVSHNIEKWIDEIYNASLYLTNTERGYVKCHWVSIAAYDRQTHKGMLRLSDELAPFILGLEGTFGGYDIGTMMMLKKVHVIRIYDLLNAKCRGFEFANKQSVYLSIAEIRFACALDPIDDDAHGKHMYEKAGSLMQKIIDPAIKAIEELKDLKIECTARKDGNKYTGFDFYIVPSFLVNKVEQS